MTEGTSRGGNGRFARSIKAAQRDAAAAARRATGCTYQQIADELGFASKGKAYEAVQRAFAGIPTEDAEEAKRLDLERIDRLIEAAQKVLKRQHVTVSQGKIVGRFKGFARDPDTGEIVRGDDDKPIPEYEELEDDAPVLAAIDRIEKLLARRAKIIGYEAPVRARIEVITEDAVDAECRKLEQEIAALDGAHPGAA
jgi:hypothetical protein